MKIERKTNQRIAYELIDLKIVECTECCTALCDLDALTSTSPREIKNDLRHEIFFLLSCNCNAISKCIWTWFSLLIV